MNAASSNAPEAQGRIGRWIAGWNPYDPARLAQSDLEPMLIEESTIRRQGTRFVLFAMGMFLAWAVTMPLDAGVTMAGNVVVAGYRKAVQHPSGGVVRAINVVEGSHVRQGDILVSLNPDESDAAVTGLTQEFINLLATESRLNAEARRQSTITWEPELADLDPAKVATAKATQAEYLKMRRSQFQEQLRGLGAQGQGLATAVAAHRQQLQTLSQEYASAAALARDGYVPQTQVNTALRNKADQESALGTAEAEIGKIRAQGAGLGASFLGDVARDLAEVQKNHIAIASKLHAARFTQSLATIRAPVTGTVVGLKIFTVGGVISSGELLMEIVPSAGRLIIEAEVPPRLIDKVRAGLKADMRLTSFNQTTTPVIEGIVRSVGVDKFKARPGETAKDGEDYYLAQIETTPAGMAALGHLRLQAGMPADVIIKSGERTFSSYLLKPLADKFARAFKE
jgi:protease secretion system membrane fusion protein